MAVSGNTLIGTRYRLDEKVGQGGMGTVYRGLDTQTGEMVAVKQLQAAAVASEPGVLERFSREGEALRQLNHPNIVKRLAAVEENGGHYLVMEYVAGGDLYSLLRREGKLPIQRILEIGLDLADALTRAHRLQIVHRDLKPANVLLAEDGTPRLTDFGVAFIASKERVTGTGVAVGTLDYLSPESLKSDVIDTRTDIWSFGVMLFEMLTGKRPFSNENVSQTLMSIVADPVPDIEHLRPDTPIGLVDLICRMLEKDPHARIPTVRQVGLELERLLQGRGASSTRVPVISPDDKRFATPTPTHSHRNNLPAQTTPFVGRETELAELKRLIGAEGVRLVTILAPGGMGKTRISLEVGSQYVTSAHDSTSHEDHFHNGVFFVELAPLTAAENIPAAIAEAVGYQFLSDEREPKQQILDFLREKSILLLLDNFEHLINGAAITSEILRAAPQVKIIATSRQRLNQSGETILNLEGMDFPDWETPADALEYSAVKLFMQSAQRARPGFELQTEDLQYIARICRMVEGLPLGILLAASWLEMLSPQEIAEEMARSLDFLETQMSDIPERQRSIRAVFDYSWNLMNPEEQGAFMRLSVFRGGFTREAAQAVSGAVLRTLMNLLNKSVLRRDPDSGRYMVHELLRQYASDRLKDAGLADETHNAHSDYFAGFVQKYEPLLIGATQRTAFKDVETEMENIHDAMHWAARHRRWDNIERSIQPLIVYYELVSRFMELVKLVTELEALMLASGLGQDSPLLWRVRVAKSYGLSRSGHFQEGYALGEDCSKFFEEHNNPQQIALICASQCYASMMVGNYAEAKACGQHGYELSGEHGYRWEMLGSAFNLGYVHFLAGEYDQAKNIYERILEKAEKVGSPPSMTAFACNNLGEILHALDDDRAAKPLFEKALALFQEINNKYGMAFSLNNIGNVAHAAADYQTAQRYNQQALDLYREIGDRRGTADALNRMGGVAFSMGEYGQAQPYHEEALATYRAIGDKRGMANSLIMLANAPNAFGDHALALRYIGESLALRRELGNPLEIADALWFMSLNTALGNGTFEESIGYLDEADKILEQAGSFEPRLTAFHAIVHLIYGRYAEAKSLFAALMPNIERINLPWILLQVTAGMGSALYGLGQYDEAKPYLQQSIEIGLRIKTLDWAMLGASGGAALIGKEGDMLDAVAWLAFISDDVHTIAFIRRQARQYLADLLTELSAQDYAAAVERSKTLDANSVIEQVLAALQERG